MLFSKSTAEQSQSNCKKEFSLKRIRLLRRSAVGRQGRSKNSWPRTAPHLSDLTAERNTHVHFNSKPQRASRRPIRPKFQNRRRDALSGMDREGGQTANGARNR